MARLVWRFVEAEILSGGGALWSAATDLPPSPRSQLGGVVVRLFPVPEIVERRLRLLKLLKVRVMRSRSTATTALQGGGSFELRPVDFPSAMGLLPIQGCGGGAAAARRRHVFFDDDVFDVLQDWIEATKEYLKVAKKHGLTPVQLAHGFVRDRPFTASTIIGATTMDQLKENIDAFTSAPRPLPPQVIDDIETVFKRYRDPAVL